MRIVVLIVFSPLLTCRHIVPAIEHLLDHYLIR
jgi:hypothetical protein